MCRTAGLARPGKYWTHIGPRGGLEQDGGSHNGAETEIYAGPTLPAVMAALFPPRFRFPLAIFHDDVSPRRRAVPRSNYCSSRGKLAIPFPAIRREGGVRLFINLRTLYSTKFIAIRRSFTEIRGRVDLQNI